MKKIIILILSLLILLGSGYFVFINYAYVIINDNKIALSEIDNYSEIILSNLDTLDVVIDNIDGIDECFSYSLDGTYEYNIKDLFHDVSIPVVINIDDALLSSILNTWNDNLIESKDAYVDVDNEQLIQEVQGTKIDVDAAITDIHDAAKNNSTILLSKYVINPTVTAADLELNFTNYVDTKSWHVSYKDCDINVVIPDDYIELHSDGSYEIKDIDFIDECVEEVSKTFNTVGKTHKFTTTNGSIVSVSGGTLGDVIDKEAEKAALLELYSQAVPQEDRVPIYSKTIPVTFDTYVEVSLENQHVWFYKDNELVMESDCVSGTKGTSRETPTGMWFMDIVMPGKMLYPSGESSGTWVDRWMRFTPDGCGLHDASWRGKFGGNIYTYNGSHGCVNLPKSFAFELYEYAYVGLPVIVY